MKPKLSKQEKQRLCDLWNSRAPMEQADIGKVMGMSRSWVQMIESQATAKLRKHMGIAA